MEKLRTSVQDLFLKRVQHISDFKKTEPNSCRYKNLESEI